MKKLATIAVIVALTAAVAVVWAQAPQAGPPAGVQAGHGPYGQHMRGPGGPGGGMMLLMRGTVEVNAESKAVWDRITDLQMQVRATQWELFTLKSEGADEEQLRTKVEELRALQEQIRAAHEEFRQFVTPPEGFGPGQGMGAGAGMGPRDGTGRGAQGGGQGLHRGACDGECNCPHEQEA